MKVKLDENLPDDLASLLRAADFDVATVAEEGMAGYDDPPVLQAATAEDRVLMSFDLGFADVREYLELTPVSSCSGSKISAGRR